MSSRHLVEVPPPFTNYVNAVKEDNLLPALKKTLRRFLKLADGLSSKKAEYAYGEGKWTIKEVLQHLIDAERVFVYRALSFSRNDQTPLPSFDENTWAANSFASEREWDQMVEEFIMLRKSTISFFETLTEDQLMLVGTASNKQLNVVGLGFVTAGHLQHHINIIKERYLPQLKRMKKLDKIKKALNMSSATDSLAAATR